jgi:hypothetical protein
MTALRTPGEGREGHADNGGGGDRDKDGSRDIKGGAECQHEHAEDRDLDCERQIPVSGREATGGGYWDPGPRCGGLTPIHEGLLAHCRDRSRAHLNAGTSWAVPARAGGRPNIPWVIKSRRGATYLAG